MPGNKRLPVRGEHDDQRSNLQDDLAPHGFGMGMYDLAYTFARVGAVYLWDLHDEDPALLAHTFTWVWEPYHLHDLQHVAHTCHVNNCPGGIYYIT